MALPTMVALPDNTRQPTPMFTGSTLDARLPAEARGGATGQDEPSSGLTAILTSSAAIITCRGHGKADANGYLGDLLLPKPDRAPLSTARMGNGAGRGRFIIVRGCPLGTVQDHCEWHTSGTAAEDDPVYGCVVGSTLIVR
jgi:hypothetical protein